MLMSKTKQSMKTNEKENRMEEFDDSKLHENLTLLGQSKSKAQKTLECFPAPPGVGEVELSSDEITAHCPLTGQPDFYSIHVYYQPDQKCIESKAFKLYLMAFRDEGHFIEALSKIMLDDLVKACEPKWMKVVLRMNPRGGITIIATSEYSKYNPV